MINEADEMHSFNKSDFDSNYVYHQFVFITCYVFLSSHN